MTVRKNETPEERAERLAKIRAYYWANREKIRTRRKGYAMDHEKERAYAQRYRDKNREKVRVRSRIARLAKIEERRAADRKRYANNLNHRLGMVMRNRLGSAIKNGQKAGSAVRDLGCTIPELKAHLEAQFTEGMSWANWGHTGDVWHIDHRRALASFNLTDREQFLDACHYSNLQPLWAEENLRKGATCGILERGN